MNAFEAGSSQGLCRGPQLLRLLGLPWFLSFPRPVNYPGSIWFLSPFPLLERHPGLLSFTMSVMKGLPQAYVTVLSNSESHSPGPPRGIPPSLGHLHKSISNALLSRGLGGWGESDSTGLETRAILLCFHCTLCDHPCDTGLEDPSLSPQDGKLLKAERIKSQRLVNSFIKRMNPEAKTPKDGFHIILVQSPVPGDMHPF